MPSRRCAGVSAARAAAGWRPVALVLALSLLLVALVPTAVCVDAEGPPLLLHREVQAVSESHATQFGACEMPNRLLELCFQKRFIQFVFPSSSVPLVHV